MLVRLIYASTVAVPMTADVVDSILKVARSRNELRDLTGCLVMNHEYFLQALEGKRDTVNRLLGTLMSDTRHKDIHILDFAEIEQRDFGQWSMGFMSAAAIQKALILRHGVSGNFDPYSMSAAGSRALLSSVSASAEPG